MTTFAGFPETHVYALLPRGTLAHRLTRYKARQHRLTGPYYGKPALANKREDITFYFDSDFAPALRHTVSDNGWYLDDDCCDTINGFAMRLPHGRGFLAGATMGAGMISYLSRDVWDNERDALAEGDRMAERVAEDERQYRYEHRDDEGGDE